MGFPTGRLYCVCMLIVKSERNIRIYTTHTKPDTIKEFNTESF